MNKIYKNKRILTLGAMATAAFIMLIAEADSLGALAVSKAAGIMLVWATYRLGKHWHISDELDKYLKEE